jgi:hypothetical protein
MTPPYSRGAPPWPSVSGRRASAPAAPSRTPHGLAPVAGPSGTPGGQSPTRRALHALADLCTVLAVAAARLAREVEGESQVGGWT